MARPIDPLISLDPATDLDLAIDPANRFPLLTVDHVDRGVCPMETSDRLATHCDPAIAIDLAARSGYRYRSVDPIVRLMPATDPDRMSKNMVFLAIPSIGAPLAM